MTMRADIDFVSVLLDSDPNHIVTRRDDIASMRVGSDSILVEHDFRSRFLDTRNVYIDASATFRLSMSAVIVTMKIASSR